MILETLTAGPLGTNAYLVGCPVTKKCVVIDAPQGFLDPLLKKISSHGLILDKVFFTHSHWDHIADAFVLKQKTGAPVYIHEADAPNLIHPGTDRLPLYFPIMGVSVDHYLSEGQKIEVGELCFTVIHTPYHSPGSVCFYLEKEGVLFSGDSLFQGGVGNMSLPTAQPHLMKGSMAKLFKLPGKTHVFPGHGESTTINEEKDL